MTVWHNFPPQIIDAIKELNPTTQVTTKADGSIVWHDDNPTNITQEQIDTKLAELTTEYVAKDYQRKRKAEYPSIEECIHAILDDYLTGLQLKRKLIKEKYPKP